MRSVEAETAEKLERLAPEGIRIGHKMLKNFLTDIVLKPIAFGFAKKKQLKQRKAQKLDQKRKDKAIKTIDSAKKIVDEYIGKISGEKDIKIPEKVLKNPIVSPKTKIETKRMVK